MNGAEHNSLSEKEQKILEAALAIFSEKGFNATTTSEIAKRAGIAEGTIFRYYKTKKDLMSSILIMGINAFSSRLVMEPIEKILNEAENKDLKIVLKEVVYDRLKLIETFFPMARVMVTEALYHEEVRAALYTNIVEKAAGLFRTFFLKAREKGLVRKELESDAALRAVIGNIAILIGQKTLFSDKFTLDDMDAEIDKTIDILFYGIAGGCSGNQQPNRAEPDSL